MIRATLASLLARKARLVMSAMAIILGTAFVAGSLIFTDTLGKTFDGITQGTVGDVVVRAEGPSGDDDGGGQLPTGARLSPEDVDRLAELPGVARADGQVESFGVFLVGRNGKVVGGQGAPALAFNWNDAPNQNGEQVLDLVDGREPRGEGEAVVDVNTAERAGYTVGDDVDFVSATSTARFTATLVGTVRFGEGGVAGASISVFDTTTAQRYFLGGEDAYTSVWVTAQDGTSQAAVADEASRVVPDGFSARTGEAIADEQQDAIDQALSFITTFLLVFAGIALFVGSFLIVNTFSILVAQRGRELALLRAIGAGRHQVTRSVLLEAFLIGLVGSTLGAVLGLGLAVGIKALFATFGLDLSGSGLVVAPRTILAVYLVGLVVTMLAAWVPARRAGRVAPVAAMRDTTEASPRGSRVRLGLEVGLLVLGALVFLAGLFVVETDQVYWIGPGVVGLLLGTAFLAPFVGRPVISGLGAIYRRLFGAVGRMAELNAVRNPGRTAATASALMIGMTLVALMGVVSQSTKASIDQQIADTFPADYLLSNAITQPFSSSVTEEVAQVPGVRLATPVRFARTTVDGGDLRVAAIDPSTFGEVERIATTSGSVDDLGARTVLLNTDHEGGRQVGGTVEVDAGGRPQSFRIAGFYDDTDTMGSPGAILATTGMERLGVPPTDNAAYIFVDDGADLADVRQRVEQVVDNQPLVTLKDQQSYADEQTASINQLLYLIYALLGLAIVIAVLGIVNTLGLSVVERTREIGLLRAVGLSRAQLRRMIRLESVTIALLGALLGIVLGVVSGVAIVQALRDEGITELAIPWTLLLTFVVVSGVVGVLAALLPARRAARLDVLQAIAAE